MISTTDRRQTQRMCFVALVLGGLLMLDAEIYAPLISVVRTEANTMYMANAVDLFCERITMRSPRSVFAENMRRVLERFIERQRLSSSKLTDVTSLNVENYIQSRIKDTYRGKPLSNRTLNNEIDTLNAFFRHFGPKEMVGPGRKNLGLLAIHQVPYCEPITELEPDPVVLHECQIEAFLRAAADAKSPRPSVCDPRQFWHALILLDGITMLRRRGLIEIERPDDDTLINRRLLILPARSNKTKKREVISLGTNQAVIETITSLPTKPGERLLPWKKPDGTPLSLTHLSQTVRRIQLAAGIPETQRIRLKDLRSTGATLTGEEFGELTAKAKLKHSPNTNTFRVNYLGRRVSEDEIKATDALSARLLDSIHRASQPELRVTG